MNAGDTAWLLACAALVMLMTPGLALFYGGMTRSKGVLNMLMLNFISLAVVSVLWMLYGFSLAFGNDAAGGLIGNFDYAGLTDAVGKLAGFAVAATDTTAAVAWPGNNAVPVLAFVMFQLMFAVITPALISGAIAERTRFWSWALFIALWATLVYFPVAHWVFAFTGFIGENAVGGWIANDLKALDFAGGTAVHINAGAAALALALVLGRRVGWPKEPTRPHNVPFVLLGASLLWFGWYGFNAGSALTAGDLAAVAFTNTTIATAAAVLGWIIVEQFRDGKPTTLGAASGAIAGLVAVTPAAGYVDMYGALVIGVIAGAVCALAVAVKYRLGFDDSLDVVAVHLVGGLVGTLLIGLFATKSVNAASLGGDGLFYGGGVTQLGRQIVAAGAVLAYSFVLAFAIGWVINKTIGFRVSTDAEVAGVDETEHAESAYEFGALRGGGGVSIAATAPSAVAGSKVPATAGKEG